LQYKEARVIYIYTAKTKKFEYKDMMNNLFIQLIINIILLVIIIHQAEG